MQGAAVTRFAESEVEEAALGWLEGLGYQVLYGAAIAPGEPKVERPRNSHHILGGG